MKIKLTPEQYEQLKEDNYLDIIINEKEGISIHIEYGSQMNFEYCEISQTRITGYPKKFCFDDFDLKKLSGKKVIESFGNYKKCPTCLSPLLYNYECCPKCGQVIDWREE